MRLPPHRHKASDIVESQDDYLLPYLRSLRDPSKIEGGIIEGSPPLPEGTEFPVEPYDMQFFRLTQDIEGYPAALYRYDELTDTWLRLQLVHFEGEDFPTDIDFLIGDTFWDTVELKFYKWNGIGWVFTGAAFSVDEHGEVEHLASMLNQAIQPYNSNITFARKTGSEHNAITYTAGEVKFQDGTARSITPGAELTSLPVGNTYIYFKLDSASLFATTNHATAISAYRGLLAIIIVASASDPDVPCAIQPFYAKGLNITADVMSVILLSAICANLGNVNIAGGEVLLGDNGIVAADGSVIIDDWGITVIEEALRFKGTANLRGIIFGHEDDHELNITAYEDMRITVLGSGAPLGDLTLNVQGSVRPPIDHVRNLGKPSYTWRFFTPRTTLANRPAPIADLVGLLWATRETDAEEKGWLCGLNAGGTVVWIELTGGNGGGDMLKSVYDTNDDGVIDLAAIPDLDTSKITTGTFAQDRIPVLSKYKYLLALLTDGSRDLEGDLIPDGDGTRSLGSSSRHFQEVWTPIVSSDDNPLDIGTISSDVLNLFTNNISRWKIGAGGNLLPYIDASYNIGSGTKRVGTIFAETVTEGDHVFEEKTCAVCGGPFKVGESLSYSVKSVSEEGTRTVPMHARCG